MKTSYSEKWIYHYPHIELLCRGGDVMTQFIVHLMKVARGSENMTEIEKSPVAGFFGLPRGRSHIWPHRAMPRNFQKFQHLRNIVM